MADIRCPMCGKQNPAERDTCQYCQARLKPLVITPTPEASKPESSPSASKDLPQPPDWLGGLRNKQEEQAQPEEKKDDLLEWTYSDSEPESSASAPKAEAQTPDWLSSMRKSAPRGEETAGTQKKAILGDRSPSDWLSSMRSDQDWLEDVSPDNEPGETTGEAVSGGESQEDPIWLMRIRARQAGDEISLRGRKSDSPEQTPPEISKEKPEVGSQPAGENFDWLTGGTESKTEHADLPSKDWWGAVTPEKTEIVDGELPDWLAEVKPAQDDMRLSMSDNNPPQSMEEQPPAAVVPEIASVDQPDRLDPGKPVQLQDEVSSKDADAEPAQPLTEPVPETPQTPSPVGKASWNIKQPLRDQDNLDWLSAFHAPQEDHPELSENEAAGAPEILPAMDEDIPDWMAGIFAAGPAVTSTGGSQAQPGPGIGPEDLAWLSDLNASTAPKEETRQPSAPREAETHPGSPVAPFANDEESRADLAPLFGTEELPSWLKEAAPTGITPRSSPSAFVGDDPGSGGSAGGITPAILGGEADADLVPAQLPSWLEAMRPVISEVESPQVDEHEGLIESAGPLAGLRSVLPAEPEVSQAQKPAAIPLKIQIPETQQVHAALLTQLIESEGVTFPVSAKPIVSSQHLLRLLIGVALFVVIIVPFLAGGTGIPLPFLPPESKATLDLIEGLSSNAPVLVAFDYQPGLTGEMDAAASAVIDHLMIKGAYLGIVSTSPTGMIQAERVLTGIAKRGGPTYKPGDQYTNLGFIPGGQTGLLSLAEAPQLTQVLPEAAGSKGLKDVKTIKDFNLVVVITENPDTARTWIEQTGNVLAGQVPGERTVPLVMIVSAQAEPLVRPFYETYPRQIQGLITGLSGAAAYENTNGRNGLARSYWSSFSFGLLFGALLISIGAVFNAAAALLDRRKKKAGG